MAAGSGDASPFPRLHVVTDDEVLADPSFAARAAEVLEAGGPSIALHLRGRGTGGRALFDLAAALLPIARSTGARLVINDRVDVALAAGVRAVHLGRRSLPVAAARALAPDATFGRSVHSAADAGECAGVEYVIAGHVFASDSHPGVPGSGPTLLREVRASVGVPVVGIGGITPARVAEVLAAGASGVAVLGGVWQGSHGAPTVRVGKYLAALAEEGSA